MEIYKAIEKRRTIRVFKKGATQNQLRKIILAGTKAPSGGNRQNWEFIVIDAPKIIDQLGEIKYRLNRTFTPDKGETRKDIEARALFQKKSFENATIVAVCSSRGQTVNGWLCAENMSLAAVAEGLGTGIVSYWDKAQKEAEKVLRIPKKYELALVLKIGVPGELPGRRKLRPESSWLHRNKF